MSTNFCGALGLDAVLVCYFSGLSVLMGNSVGGAWGDSIHVIGHLELLPPLLSLFRVHLSLLWELGGVCPKGYKSMESFLGSSNEGLCHSRGVSVHLGPPNSHTLESPAWKDSEQETSLQYSYV